MTEIIFYIVMYLVTGVVIVSVFTDVRATYDGGVGDVEEMGFAILFWPVLAIIGVGYILGAVAVFIARAIENLLTISTDDWTDE